jgi:hypothetical protein
MWKLFSPGVIVIIEIFWDTLIWSPLGRVSVESGQLGSLARIGNSCVIS